MTVKPIAEYAFSCQVCSRPAVTCQPADVYQNEPAVDPLGDAKSATATPQFAGSVQVSFRCREHAAMPRLIDGIKVNAWLRRHAAKPGGG